MLLASRIMVSIYSAKPKVSLEMRKSDRSQLHLELEAW